METMFETKRLLVRKFREEDARPLYENHKDEEVRKWFPNECYADEAEALDAIRFYADCVDNGHLPFVLAVELKETGELIGDTGISEVDGHPEETEIGYCVGEKYRGKGYASELLDAISGFVFSRFGILKIYGRVVHGNGASARVLEKNGYRFVKEEFGAEDDPYGKGMLVYLKEDWRLSGQDRYLMDKELYFIPFAKYSDTWDHEHCAFCWARFSDHEGDLHEGYCSEPSNTSDSHWICPECYQDFKELFRWKLHK